MPLHVRLGRRQSLRVAIQCRQGLAVAMPNSRLCLRLCSRVSRLRQPPSLQPLFPMARPISRYRSEPPLPSFQCLCKLCRHRRAVAPAAQGNRSQRLPSALGRRLAAARGGWYDERVPTAGGGMAHRQWFVACREPRVALRWSMPHQSSARSHEQWSRTLPPCKRVGGASIPPPRLAFSNPCIAARTPVAIQSRKHAPLPLAAVVAAATATAKRWRVAFFASLPGKALGERRAALKGEPRTSSPVGSIRKDVEQRKQRPWVSVSRNRAVPAGARCLSRATALPPPPSAPVAMGGPQWRAAGGLLRAKRR